MYTVNPTIFILAIYVSILIQPDRSAVLGTIYWRNSLDPCRETDDGKEEAIYVEVFKHALNGLTVNSERHARGSEIQTAAHHII